MSMNTSAFSFDPSARAMVFELHDEEGRTLNEYQLQFDKGFCQDSFTSPAFSMLGDTPPVPLEELYYEVSWEGMVE